MAKEKNEKECGLNPTLVLVRHYRLKELRELGTKTTRVISYINSFRDLSEDEKADIYDDYHLQTNGDTPKTNPWRK